MKSILNRPNTLMFFGAILAIGIFSLDLMEPLGVAGGVLYMSVVFLGLWVHNKYYTLVSAIATSALTVAGFFLSPPGGEMWSVVANRAITLFVIWLTAILCLKYRKKTESALSQTQEQFRSVFDHAMDGILTIDDMATVQSVNASAERMFGFEAAEIIGRNLNMLMPEPYKGEHDGYVRRYRETGEARVMGAAREVLGQRKDGSIFPLEISVSEFFQGTRRMFVGIVRDISERKQAEAETRMMSKVFMDSADPILIEDLNGNIIDLNREAERAYKFKRSELLGKPVKTLVPADRHEQADKLLERCRKGEEVRNIEGMRWDRDQKRIPVLLTLSQLKDEEGKTTAIAVIAKDVTEQKRVEAETRMLSKVFMDSADPIIIEDLNGNIMDLNREAERAYKFKRSELLGKPIKTLVPPDRHEQADELLERCRKGEEVRNIEGVRKDNEEKAIPVLLTLSQLKDEEGRTAAIATIAKDITEQKRVEAETRMLSKVFMDSADPILIEDLHGNIVDLNSEAERAYKFKRSELLGESIKILIPPEGHEQADELRVLCKKGEEVRNVDGVKWNRHQKRIPVLLTLSQLKDDAGITIAIATNAKDITEKKRVEAETRMMSKVFMDSADPIIIEDLTGHIMDLNSEAERAYKFKRSELLGESIKMLVPPEGHEQADELRVLCKKGEEVRNIEVVKWNRHQKRIPMLLTLSQLKDEDGTTIAIATIAKNITEQKRVEAETRMLSKVFMDSVDPIIIEDLNGNIMDLNREAEQAYKFKRSELLGEPIKILVPADRHAQADELLERCRNGEEVRSVEGVRWNRHQKRIPVLLTLSQLKDDAGTTVAIATNAKDITRQKRAEKELEKERANLEIAIEERTGELAAAQQAAEQANQSKSAFLANMSHEIRTPMNAILGYSQILQRDKSLAEKQKTKIDSIYRAGNHLLSVINEILDFSKIEAGRMELHTHDFSLGTLVGDLDSLFRHRCEIKGLKFTIEGMARSDNVLVHGDEAKLRQVLVNLLGNSAKFTDRGEVRLIIHPKENDDFYFEVMDTGAGIPEKKQATIFIPFQQDREGVDKGGTGLGLTISKKQVELMGGKLELKSEFGKGASFFFTLHFTKANELVNEKDKRLKNAEKIAKGFAVDAVVIDDNQANVDVLSETLSALGIKVREALSGAEGLDLIQSSVPDVVLVDYAMPEMDGVEVSKEIIRKYGADKIKIIMVSASAFNHDRERFLKEGIHAFVGKPFVREVILGTLSRLLKVEYEYAEEKEKAKEPREEVDVSGLKLPQQLVDSLRKSIKLGMMTEFKESLSELGKLEPNGEDLADHLNALADDFNKKGIVNLLDKIQIAG